MTIRQQLLALLWSEFPDAEWETPFSELGLDSLDYIDFLLKVETEFNVSIPKEATPSNAAELAAVVKELL